MAIKGKEDETKEFAARMPNRKYAYFRDDQITFLVTHSEGLVANKQLQDFATAINGKLEPVRQKLRGGMPRGIIEKTPEAISFPKFTGPKMLRSKGARSLQEQGGGSEAFSIIKCELTGAPTNPDGLLDIIGELNKQLPPNKASQQVPVAGLTIQGSSPNWLTSAASQGGATGGPGGKPSPYYGNRKTAPGAT